VRGELHTGLVESLSLPAPDVPDEVFAAAASVLSRAPLARAAETTWPGPFEGRFRMGDGA
jgi:hypothetical protein